MIFGDLDLYTDGVSLHGLIKGETWPTRTTTLSEDCHHILYGWESHLIYCITILDCFETILSIKSHQRSNILASWFEKPCFSCVTLAMQFLQGWTSGGYRARAAIPEDIERRGHFTCAGNLGCAAQCWHILLAFMLGRVGAHVHCILVRIGTLCIHCLCAIVLPENCSLLVLCRLMDLLDVDGSATISYPRVYCCNDCPSPSTASISQHCHWNCPPKI